MQGSIGNALGRVQLPGVAGTVVEFGQPGQHDALVVRLM